MTKKYNRFAAVALGRDLTGAPAPFRLEILNYRVVGTNRISWQEAAEILEPLHQKIIEKAVDAVKRTKINE